MERIHGLTLRAEIARTGGLPCPAAGEWFDQLLAGVAAAHAHEIVHRDLKPENIVGCQAPDGGLRVKVLDFGLAKARPLDATLTMELTADGMVLGTFGYMSPEQLLGQSVDHRSDIFALGVVLVETLTGVRPFGGGSYNEPLRSVLYDRYHLPGAAPEVVRLDDALQRCLARDANDRFPSAEELRAELLPALRACPPLLRADTASGESETVM